MTALCGIGDALDPSIGKTKPGAALDVGKEYINPRPCPGNLQTVAIKGTVLDGLAIGAAGHLACIVQHECIAGFNPCRRVLRIRDLDQSLGLAQEWI